MNAEHILSELKQSREALDAAIAYIEAGALAGQGLTAVRSKTIKAGEGRAISILTGLRDAGGKLLQRGFEDVCLCNARTLVGAGGFIARGSITRQETPSGEIEYELTEKGLEAINKWEIRYGAKWQNDLEKPDILGNTTIHDQQKIKLFEKTKNNA